MSTGFKFILPHEKFTSTLFMSKPQVLKKNVFLQGNKSRDSCVIGSNNAQDMLMETTSIYDGKSE